MNTKQLKKRIVYSGSYREVQFEIVNWNFGVESPTLPSQCWNYYLFLELKKFSNQELAELLWLKDKEMPLSPTSPVRIAHDYFSNPFLADLNMHGGITYYEKKYFDKEKVIKVGCDFQHLHDNETNWELEGVFNDLKDCVDKMLATSSYGQPVTK